MLNDDILKTPQEFIDEETTNLKTYLQEKVDVQVNKLGIIGFFMNLLGNIRYDSTQYYQNLFSESNIITAKDENNLYMHSSLYGYIPDFAKPSKAEGSFVFNFASLPKSNSTNDDKRTVILSDITFKVNEISFTTNTIYKFVEEGNSYYVIVYLEDGTITHIPSSSSQIIAPFVNVYQQSIETEIIPIPNYDFYTHYSYTFDTSDKFLNELTVFIKEKDKVYDDSKGEEFEIKIIKFLENSVSKSCFLKMLSTHDYRVEFGSGIRGRYVPNSTATLIKKLTYGKEGHVGVANKLGLDKSSTLKLQKDDNPSIINNQFIIVDFLFSSDGTNPKTSNELRTDIIKHIQTRDFLINKRDYENLTQMDDNEFVYSFKKTSIQRNDFYLYQCFRDENQLPVTSLCYNFRILNTKNPLTNVTVTPSLETGSLDGIYKYYIFATDGFHINLPLLKNNINCTSPNNTVTISWDQYPNALAYIIIVADEDDNYRYHETQNLTFKDNGQDGNSINQFCYLENISNVITPKISWENNYIFQPEYEGYGKTFISPLVYKYNNFMNWFEGNLFYDDFIVLFSRNNTTNFITQTHTVPYFHANIKYNYDEKLTTINIISQQNCAEYTGKISITNTNITNQQLIRKTENQFYITIKENPYGILFNNHLIELKVYYCDDTDTIIGDELVIYSTSLFSQIQNLADQIKLVKYEDINNELHLLSIPLIEKSIYESDKEFYNLKLLNNIFNTNISQNRFPNDEIQYRFINNYYMENRYLIHVLKQQYTFDITFPLLLEINIIYDQIYLDNNKVNLSKEKDDLYLAIANKLQKEYTGNNITYYNSHIVDFIHTSRPYIKTLYVTVKDSSVDSNILYSGLETNDERVILEKLQNFEPSPPDPDYDNKLEICYYTPYYFWWDVDNIIFTYNF